MKTITFFCTLVLIVNLSFGQQFNAVLGSDLKILLFGTENQFTSHSEAFNMATKIEYIDDTNNYFAIGYTYVDLYASYDAFYLNIGKRFEPYTAFFLIPQIELGRISRNGPGQHLDVQPLYAQLNLSVRYAIIKEVFVDFAFNLQWSRDLPDRTFRYGGVFSLVTPIFIN